MKNLVKVEQTISTGIIPFESVKDHIEHFIKSGAMPSHVTTSEMAYTMINYGREHGFKPIQSLHFLTPVNGTLTINAKGISAKLSQNNIITLPEKYAAYVYVYRDKEITSERVLQPREVLSRFNLVEEFNAGDDEKKKLLLSYTTPIDRITTLKYGYKTKDWKINWIGEQSYFWSDVLESELDKKDTYLKYPRTMMMHRCKTEICKILGLITESEYEETVHATTQENPDMELIDIDFQEANE